MFPMRRPDHDSSDATGDTGDPGAIGHGFGVDGGDIDSGYGSDAGFYGDGDHHTDGSLGGDNSFDDDSVVDDGPGEITEDEAEDVLTDVLEDDYGDQADEVVQEMEDSTGMSATELLEDITGLDLNGDGVAGSSAYSDSDIFEADAQGGFSPLEDNPFEPVDVPDADMPEVDMASSSDFDLNSDGHVNVSDLHEAAHPFDFHAGQ